MHIEEYITSVGKQHRNERQNYEFHSISSLIKFIEDLDAVNQNLVKSNVSGSLLLEKFKNQLKDRLLQNCFIAKSNANKEFSVVAWEDVVSQIDDCYDCLTGNDC